MLTGGIRGGPNTKQTTLQERRKRADALINRIILLRKPHMYETMHSMSDSKRIFQTLLNTENIENKTNQSQILLDYDRKLHDQQASIHEVRMATDEAPHKGRKNGKDAEHKTEPVEADSDSLDNQKQGKATGSSLSAQQIQQNIFEIDETRKIMIKRRKPMPLIEEFNLDDIFTEEQRNQLLRTKRRRLDSLLSGSHKDPSTNDSNFNASDSGEQVCMPLKEEERALLSKQLTDRCLANRSVIQNNPEAIDTHQNAKKPLSIRLSFLKEHCSLLLMNYLTRPANMQVPSQSGRPQFSVEDNKAVLNQHQNSLNKECEKQILDFFNCQVANQNPDLLIDVCDFWLSQI